MFNLTQEQKNKFLDGNSGLGIRHGILFGQEESEVSYFWTMVQDGRTPLTENQKSYVEKNQIFKLFIKSSEWNELSLQQRIFIIQNLKYIVVSKETSFDVIYYNFLQFLQLRIPDSLSKRQIAYLSGLPIFTSTQLYNFVIPDSNERQSLLDNFGFASEDEYVQFWTLVKMEAKLTPKQVAYVNENQNFANFILSADWDFFTSQQHLVIVLYPEKFDFSNANRIKESIVMYFFQGNELTKKQISEMENIFQNQEKTKMETKEVIQPDPLLQRILNLDQLSKHQKSIITLSVDMIKYYWKNIIPDVQLDKIELPEDLLFIVYMGLQDFDEFNPSTLQYAENYIYGKASNKDSLFSRDVFLWKIQPNQETEKLQKKYAEKFKGINDFDQLMKFWTLCYLHSSDDDFYNQVKINEHQELFILQKSNEIIVKYILPQFEILDLWEISLIVRYIDYLIFLLSKFYNIDIYNIKEDEIVVHHLRKAIQLKNNFEENNRKIAYMQQEFNEPNQTEMKYTQNQSELQKNQMELEQKNQMDGEDNKHSSPTEPMLHRFLNGLQYFPWKVVPVLTVALRDWQRRVFPNIDYLWQKDELTQFELSDGKYYPSPTKMSNFNPPIESSNFFNLWKWITGYSYFKNRKTSNQEIWYVISWCYFNGMEEKINRTGNTDDFAKLDLLKILFYNIFNKEQNDIAFVPFYGDAQVLIRNQSDGATLYSLSPTNKLSIVNVITNQNINLLSDIPGLLNTCSLFRIDSFQVMRDFQMDGKLDKPITSEFMREPNEKLQQQFKDCFQNKPSFKLRRRAHWNMPNLIVDDQDYDELSDLQYLHEKFECDFVKGGFSMFLIQSGLTNWLFTKNTKSFPLIACEFSQILDDQIYQFQYTIPQLGGVGYEKISKNNLILALVDQKMNERNILGFVVAFETFFWLLSFYIDYKQNTSTRNLKEISQSICDSLPPTKENNLMQKIFSKISWDEKCPTENFVILINIVLNHYGLSYMGPEDLVTISFSPEMIEFIAMIRSNLVYRHVRKNWIWKHNKLQLKSHLLSHLDILKNRMQYAFESYEFNDFNLFWKNLLEKLKEKKSVDFQELLQDQTFSYQHYFTNLKRNFPDINDQIIQSMFHSNQHYLSQATKQNEMELKLEIYNEIIKNGFWNCENDNMNEFNSTKLLKWMNFHRDPFFIAVAKFMNRSSSMFPFMLQQTAQDYLSTDSLPRFAICSLSDNNPKGIVFYTSSYSIEITFDVWMEHVERNHATFGDDFRALLQYVFRSIAFQNGGLILIRDLDLIIAFSRQCQSGIFTDQSSEFQKYAFKNIEEEIASVKKYISDADFMKPTIKAMSQMEHFNNDFQMQNCKVPRVVAYGRGSRNTRTSTTGKAAKYIMGEYSGMPDCLKPEDPQNENWMFMQPLMSLQTLQQIREQFKQKQFPIEYLNNVLKIWPELDMLIGNKWCHSDENRTLLLNWLGPSTISYMAANPKWSIEYPSSTINQKSWKALVGFSSLARTAFFYPFMDPYLQRSNAYKYLNRTVMTLDFTRPHCFSCFRVSRKFQSTKTSAMQQEIHDKKLKSVDSKVFFTEGLETVPFELLFYSHVTKDQPFTFAVLNLEEPCPLQTKSDKIPQIEFSPQALKFMHENTYNLDRDIHEMGSTKPVFEDQPIRDYLESLSTNLQNNAFPKPGILLTGQGYSKFKAGVNALKAKYEEISKSKKSENRPIITVESKSQKPLESKTRESKTRESKTVERQYRNTNNQPSSLSNPSRDQAECKDLFVAFTIDDKGDIIPKCGEEAWMSREPIPTMSALQRIQNEAAINIYDEIKTQIMPWCPNDYAIVRLWRWVGYQCFTSRTLKSINQKLRSQENFGSAYLANVPVTEFNTEIETKCDLRMQFLADTVNSGLIVPFAQNQQDALRISSKLPDQVVAFFDWSESGRIRLIQTASNGSGITNTWFQAEDIMQESLISGLSALRLKVFRSLAGGLLADIESYHQLVSPQCASIQPLRESFALATLPPLYKEQLRNLLILARGAQTTESTIQITSQLQQFRDLVVLQLCGNLTSRETDIVRQVAAWEFLARSNPKQALLLAQAYFGQIESANTEKLARDFQTVALCSQPQFIEYLRRKFQDMFPQTPVSQVRRMTRSELCKFLLQNPDLKDFGIPLKVWDLRNVPRSLQDPRTGYLDYKNANEQPAIENFLLEHYGITLKDFQNYNNDNSPDVLTKHLQDYKDAQIPKLQNIDMYRNAFRNPHYETENPSNQLKIGEQIFSRNDISYFVSFVIRVLAQDNTPLNRAETAFIYIAYGIIRDCVKILKSKPNYQKINLLLDTNAREEQIKQMFQGYSLIQNILQDVNPLEKNNIMCNKRFDDILDSPEFKTFNSKYQLFTGRIANRIQNLNLILNAMTNPEITPLIVADFCVLLVFHTGLVTNVFVF